MKDITKDQTIFPDALLSEDDFIVYVYPTVIYDGNKFLVLSVYQDKPLLEWLEQNTRSIFKRLGKKYDLKYMIMDVIDYNKDKLAEALRKMRSLGSVEFFRYLSPHIATDEPFPEEFGPKGIILVLKERETEEL